MDELKVTVKITSEELNALQLREDILFKKDLEKKLLQNERDMYWITLIKKYNLDEKKTYSIDKDGNVIEKKDK
jgi:hypothetical protein